MNSSDHQEEDEPSVGSVSLIAMQRNSGDHNRIVRPAGQDLKNQIFAATLIQRRVRGMVARTFIEKCKVSRAVEVSLRKSLNPMLSPAENASILLSKIASRSALPSWNVAGILYAIEVLKLNESTAEAPIGLVENEEEDQVEKWIRSEFTNIGENRAKPLHLKTVALGFMIPRRLQGVQRRRSKSESFFLPEIFTLSPPIQDVLYPEIRRLLGDVGLWEWDALELDAISKGHTLKLTSWHILHWWGLIDEFQLSKSAVFRFLEFIEMSYKDNPYHNGEIFCGGKWDVCPTNRFSHSGACHWNPPECTFHVDGIVEDPQHDGYNNSFHKKALTDRALQHNDRSVQENHHVKILFELILHKPSLNFLENLPSEARVELRRLIISAVLGRDMSRHFELTKDFKDTLEIKGTAHGKWRGSSETLLKMILHCSDISFPAKPLRVSAKWAERFLEERFQQGDHEKRLGLPVSPQCDRDETVLASSQAGFITYVVLPAFEVLGQLLPGIVDAQVPHLEANLAHWESLIRSQTI